MAKNDEYGDEEGYIDMELISSYSSPSKNREFEFQNSLSSSSNERETTTADELFYKGKLLRKLLPLLHTTTTTTTTTFDITKSPFQQYHNYYPMPFTSPSTNTANTPQDSSPSGSCRASCELNPDDYFFEWSTELSSFINSNNNHPTKKPSKKLKLINKLKASRAYLKYFFTKSPCADESNNPKAVEQTSFQNKYLSISKKKQLGQIGRASNPTIASIIKNIDNEVIINVDDNHNNNNVQRRSYSSAIKRHSPTKCLSSSSSNSSSSSSSFSANSNDFHEMQLIRRSSSATEIEGSIEAAIAHCKKSQQIFYSFSADEENQNRTGLL